MPTPTPVPKPSGNAQVIPQTWRCLNDSPTQIPGTNLDPQYASPGYTCSVTAWETQPTMTPEPVSTSSSTPVVYSDDIHRLADYVPGFGAIIAAVLVAILIAQVRGS